jgi:hypothetical protein
MVCGDVYGVWVFGQLRCSNLEIKEDRFSEADGRAVC